MRPRPNTLARRVEQLEETRFALIPAGVRLVAFAMTYMEPDAGEEFLTVLLATIPPASRERVLDDVQVTLRALERAERQAA